MASELGDVPNLPDLEAQLPVPDTIKEGEQPQPVNDLTSRSSCRRAQNMMTRDKLPWMKAWQRVEVGVICVVIVAVWGLLSLPVILYHIPPDDGNTISPASGPQSCSVYNGTACAEPLQSLQNCLPDKPLNSSEVHVSPNKPQAIVEGEAQLILTTGLGIINPTPSCTAAIVPFLCLSLFKLCASNGTSYLPSSSECVDLRSETCAEIWDATNELLVSSFGLDPLPICESLHEPSISCEASSGSGDTSGYPDGSNNSNSTIQCTRHCRDGFYCVDDLNICKPRCDEWEVQSHSTTIAFDISVIVSGISNLVLASLVLVISCVKRKTMFVFPLVFVVYMAVSVAVLGVFLLVQYVDRPGLYCSSIDLGESVDHSTPFCNIHGFMFHYILLQVSLWWFFNVIVLFWKIVFSFHAKSFEKAYGYKYLHITAVVLGVVLPAIPSISMMATGGFAMGRFPPVICYTKDPDVAFYSVILPIMVIYQIGIPLLVITFWTIHKHHGLLRTKRSKYPILKTAAERKILVVFCYFIVFTVIAITGFTLSNGNRDIIKEELTKYFLCESIGPESPCDTSAYRDLYHIELSALGYVLLGLSPASLLIFVVSNNDMKKWTPTRDSICASFRLSKRRTKTSLKIPAYRPRETHLGTTKTTPAVP